MKKKVIRMEKDGPESIGLQDIPQTDPDSIVDGNPMEKDYGYFTSEDGKLFSGVWESTAGTLVTEDYDVDEFCYLISGKLVITNHVDNSEEVFTAGDAFFIPKGTPLTWHMPETIRKFYVIRSYE